MKKIFIIAVAFGISGTLFGQGTDKQKKDSLMQAMSREACTEITKNKSDFNAENLEMSLGLVMMGLMANHASELQDVFELDMADQGSMTKFSQEFGMTLALECPEFLKMVAGKNGMNLPSPTSEKKFNSVAVTFEKIVPGDITYFQARAANGKAEKFYWLEYFDGANNLAGKLKADRKMTVRYYEMEVYNASLKEYVTIKVAAGIEMQ